MGVSFHKPVLVGRERERELLRALLERASEGQGTLALLSGEAGIGKTTLVDDLVQHAAASGFLVLSGGCYDLTTTPPYGPWTEAIRSYRPAEGGPEIPSWFGNLVEIEKLGSQMAIFEAAREFFTEVAAGQPLLIVLEDLHWADPASVDALRYLARNLRDVPVMILATYRDDEPVYAHPFFEAIPTLVRESQAERVAVWRWSEADTRELISSRYRLRSDDEERLAIHTHRLAEGNPFYTIELLHELESDAVLRPQAGGWAIGELAEAQIPPLVRQVVERRLSTLAPETRTLLEVASVIGHDVPFDLWLDVCDVEDKRLVVAVGEASAVHLIDELPDRSGIRFRHALIRETLYASSNPLDLGRLHRRVAEALTHQPVRNPDAVAFHFGRAGDERCIRWLVRAGRRAQRAAAWKAASDRYVEVSDRLASASGLTRERAWLLYHAGTLMRYADNRRSTRLIERAQREAIIAEDKDLEARCLTHLGSNFCHQGEIEIGLDYLQAGISIVNNLPWSGQFVSDNAQADAIIESLLSESGVDEPEYPIAIMADVSANPRSFPLRRVLSHWLGEAGRFQEAIRTSDELDEDVRAADIANMPDAAWAIKPHPGLSISYMMLGMPEKAWKITQQGRIVAENRGDYFLSACIIFNQLHGITVPYFTDDLNRREFLLAQMGQPSARAEDQMQGVPVRTLIQCVADRLEGRWSCARAHEDAACSVEFSFLRHAMISLFGDLDRLQGHPDAAWDRIGVLFPSGPHTEPGSSLYGPANVGQRLAAAMALDDSDLPLAHGWLEAHDRWLEWSGAVLGQAEGHLLWARYHLAHGDSEQARERAEKALACGSDPRQPLALIAAHRFLGDLDVRKKDYDAASQHLSFAADLAERCEAPYEIALSQLAQAELALATRDVARATYLLDQAKETFERLGAKPASKRAGRIATHLAMVPQSYPAGLTAREVEVLGLIAEGLSNREIAERLYLSVRTVERHVSNIYRKIEVANRVDAAAFAGQHQLTDILET
jgi:DNA-binding CsgD family transcriptional regulator